MEVNMNDSEGRTEPAPEEYTIGWICAIQKEFNAASRMLDEEFEGPEENAVNDNNTYLFGRIGDHYVVIGCCSSGRYGIGPATVVAQNMVRSFPNVRFALMVGIGGGAPTSERDIRLGDVVVSIPQKNFGGVLQYDFGQRLSDGVFRPFSQLDAPPEALLQVITKIRNRYDDPRRPDPIAKHMELMSDWPGYQRPSLGDKLFRSDYHHKGGADCQSCEDKGIEDRPKTRPTTRVVTVHYGIIASANSVMKDAKQRDQFANDPDLNVLCFEMEAAGLMNNFPCLVVRGIADYSDSHKNYAWQQYAALTAAAYAKELLVMLKPQRVVNAPSWAEKMTTTLAIIGENIETVSKNTKTIEKHQQSQEDQNILNWLAPTDYGPEQHAYLAKRYEGTGIWLLHTEEFQTWMNQKGLVLYCPGIPGAGKTIITSLVVNHLQTHYRHNLDVGIAFIYCNFKRQEQQHAVQLVRNLLKQLSENSESLRECVVKFYRTHNQRQKTQPSLEDTMQVLEAVVSQDSRTFLLVDGLDELLVSDKERQEFISALFRIRKTGANIFATSRYNDDIESQFKTCPKIHILANDQDIERYLDGQISEVSKARPNIWDENLQQKVKSEIIKAVDGMFLVAKLHASNILAKPTKGHVKEALALEKGEEGLCQLYEQAMERITSQEKITRHLACTMLMWLVHAKRLLSATELQHALSVRPETTTELESEYIPDVNMIKSVCAGLVTVDEEIGIVRLVHYTTQRYLEQTSNQWFGNAQAELTRTCVTYLSFDTFEVGVCRSYKKLTARLEVYALYKYAAQHWGSHSLEAPTADDICLSFLQNSSKISAANQAMIVENSYDVAMRRGTSVTGLHAAALFGLARVILTVFRSEQGLNAKDSMGDTPLSYAAMRGHEEVVNILLQQIGIEANSRNYDGRTPLSFAAESGHSGVVNLLLHHDGVEADSKDYSGQTPLSLAARRGHGEIVALLLKTMMSM